MLGFFLFLLTVVLRFVFLEVVSSYLVFVKDVHTLVELLCKRGLGCRRPAEFPMTGSRPGQIARQQQVTVCVTFSFGQVSGLNKRSLWFVTSSFRQCGGRHKRKFTMTCQEDKNKRKFLQSDYLQ